MTVANGLEKIQASIRDILMTRPGERLNQPEYGSRLYDLVFEPSGSITNQLLHLYTVEALSRWERRISVTAIDFIEDSNNPHYVGIVINFIVRATHQEGSYVFPYTKTVMPMENGVVGSEVQRIFAQGQVLPATGGTALLPGVAR